MIDAVQTHIALLMQRQHQHADGGLLSELLYAAWRAFEWYLSVP